MLIKFRELQWKQPFRGEFSDLLQLQMKSGVSVEKCRAFELLGSYDESIRLTSLPPPLPTKVTETINCFHLVHPYHHPGEPKLRFFSICAIKIRHFGDFSDD